MSDKVSAEDFIKAFGKGVKDNRKITPLKIKCFRDKREVDTNENPNQNTV